MYQSYLLLSVLSVFMSILPIAHCFVSVYVPVLPVAQCFVNVYVSVLAVAQCLVSLACWSVSCPCLYLHFTCCQCVVYVSILPVAQCVVYVSILPVGWSLVSCWYFHLYVCPVGIVSCKCSCWS